MSSEQHLGAQLESSVACLTLELRAAFTDSQESSSQVRAAYTKLGESDNRDEARTDESAVIRIERVGGPVLVHR